MIVAFCGHSTYVENVKDEEEVLAVLESRVGELPCEFFLGGYGNFDQFGYGCAKRFQKKHPNARLLFVTPYLSESYARNMEWRQGRFDGVIYPPLENVPPRTLHYYAGLFRLCRANRLCKMLGILIMRCGRSMCPYNIRGNSESKA